MKPPKPWPRAPAPLRPLTRTELLYFLELEERALRQGYQERDGVVRNLPVLDELRAYEACRILIGSLEARAIAEVLAEHSRRTGKRETRARSRRSRS